jgi:hypothetical protein
VQPESVCATGAMKRDRSWVVQQESGSATKVEKYD